MPRVSPNPPLRILLACARPLILKVEEWEAELKDPATRHIAAAATALQGVADISRFTANGRTMGFVLYPPRPPEKVIQEKLAGAIPLDSLKVAAKAIPQDVHRLDEEIEAIQNGLQGLEGVELYIHPAATPAEVLAFLQRNDVDVLQFTGHGDEMGGLYFEDGRGSARRVTPGELARLVRGRIKLLFTGACYSAQALSALFLPATRDSHAIPAALAVETANTPSRAVPYRSSPRPSTPAWRGDGGCKPASTTAWRRCDRMISLVSGAVRMILTRLIPKR